MPSPPSKRRGKLQRIVDRQFSYRDFADEEVEVRSAGSHGLGTFAVRAFTPGEIVLEVAGQSIAKSEYEGSEYAMDLDEDWFVEPQTPAAFLNHSCDPNCELIQVGQRKKATLVIVALCNIEPGRELTFDYGWEAFDWTPKCRCGSRRCRGWIVSADQVLRVADLKEAAKAK